MLVYLQFVCMLLGNLHEPTTAGYEIELFLNVINGAFLLLCENIVILRSCLAGFLNISRHFGHIFAINGYESSIFCIIVHFGVYLRAWYVFLSIKTTFSLSIFVR